MIILGVDPGSTITGYAIIKKQKNKDLGVIDFGCITTEGLDAEEERLKKIYKEIKKIIEKYRPTVVSIEKLFFFKNLKTAIPVSQTRGVILLAVAEKGLPTLEFTPLQVKITITGYGRATKKQVKEMIKRIVDIKKFDLKKNNRKKDDAFDALGVAMCAVFATTSC